VFFFFFEAKENATLISISNKRHGCNNKIDNG